MEARAATGAAAPIAAVALAAEDVQRALFWRKGMIGFSDTSLADAAAEFARYNRARILLPEAAVAGETITGLFVATDPAGFAQAVATSLDLEMRREGEDIVLTRAASHSDISAEHGRAWGTRVDDTGE
jgi:transmembrane sensor